MNRVTLAVAGSRKTQSIVDACADGGSAKRRLALTFTIAGQMELESRLRASRPGGTPVVMGWFTFLLRHVVRPYLPLAFPGVVLRGMNYEGDPGLYAKGQKRYFDSSGRVYGKHLAKLARVVSEASRGAAVDRIAHIFDEIYLDEVQDLTGSDLYILEELMVNPEIDVHMVGDVRQSVISTNPRDPNLKKYKGLGMIGWFEGQSASGLLEIEHSTRTWRSNQAIATFSDTLFPDYSFEPTVSMQMMATGHDGVFAIAESDVEAYLRKFDPQPLRPSIVTASTVNLPFQNFGKVKGLTFDRVLIYPTRPITDFLTNGTALAAKSACGLYVAVTRAKFSVAFVVTSPAKTNLARWPGVNEDA